MAGGHTSPDTLSVLYHDILESELRTFQLGDESDPQAWNTRGERGSLEHACRDPGCTSRAWSREFPYGLYP